MKLQPKRRAVAYLGPKGTFCEQAAEKYFDPIEVTLIPYQSLANVFNAVKNGRVHYGVVPVENSLDGSIHLTLDLLLESDLMIHGEVELRIVHNLIGKAGTSLDQIKTVISHRQAIAQCRRFLEQNLPGVELIEVSSTAKAVELLKEKDHTGAIGTEIAAKNNAMEILARQIEDERNNFTRFFILSKEDASPTGRDKTSLVFSTKDTPGSLYRVLEVFAVRKMNLTKIESRPERGKPWNYIFHLDFQGHKSEQKSREALKEMRERCIFVKILGSYPAASQ